MRKLERILGAAGEAKTYRLLVTLKTEGPVAPDYSVEKAVKMAIRESFHSGVWKGTEFNVDVKQA